MSLENVQNWLISSDGIKNDLDRLRQWSAALSFGEGVLKIEGVDAPTDWRKLLLAASILAESDEREAQEYALMVAERWPHFFDHFAANLGSLA